MAETNVTIREFFTQKPAAVTKFETLEFYHPSFGTLRFVKTFFDQTLTIEAGAPRNAGEAVVFQALNFDVSEPTQQETPNANLTLLLGRVGSEVKERIKMISGFAYMQQVEIIYRYYLSDDTSAPLKVFSFFGDQININAQDVSVNASDDNPTNFDISRLYTNSGFPGLEAS